MMSDKLHRLVNSNLLDWVGVLIVLMGSLSLGYHNTWTANGFPLGYVSIGTTVFSLLSTRYVSKQNNLGNVIGIFTAIMACIVDFKLGNTSAWLTFPVSMLANVAASFQWKKGVQVRSHDTLYYILFALSLVGGAVLTYLGFHLAGDTPRPALYITTALIVGFAFAGNIANVFKYQETWLTWMVYNGIKLFQSILLLNIANVFKYIYYIFNAIITFIDWRINRTGPSAQDRT